MTKEAALLSGQSGTAGLPTPDEIARLIARTALGDRRAFDSLYRHTSAKLFGIALRLLGDRAEAEDALQDIYIKIWQRADRYAVAKASPMSWLIAIARNHAIDRLRARRAGDSPGGLVGSIPDNAPTPEQNMMADAERARIETCLDRLEPDKADAVRSAYLEGQTYQELADRFAIPLNTIRTWLRRGLMKLKDCLEE